MIYVSTLAFEPAELDPWDIASPERLVPPDTWSNLSQVSSLPLNNAQSAHLHKFIQSLKSPHDTALRFVTTQAFTDALRTHSVEMSN